VSAGLAKKHHKPRKTGPRNRVVSAGLAEKPSQKTQAGPNLRHVCGNGVRGCQIFTNPQARNLKKMINLATGQKHRIWRPLAGLAGWLAGLVKIKFVLILFNQLYYYW